MGLRFARRILFGIAVVLAAAAHGACQSVCSIPCVVNVVDVACSQALCGENAEAENRYDHLCNPECKIAIVDGALQECLAGEKMPRLRQRMVVKGLKSLLTRTCRKNRLGKNSDDDDDDSDDDGKRIPKNVQALLERIGLSFPSKDDPKKGSESDEDSEKEEHPVGQDLGKNDQEEMRSDGDSSMGDEVEKKGGKNGKKSGKGRKIGKEMESGSDDDDDDDGDGGNSGGKKGKGKGTSRQSGRKEKFGETRKEVDEVEGGNVGDELEGGVADGVGVARNSGGEEGKGKGEHQTVDGAGRQEKKGGKRGVNKGNEPDDDDSGDGSSPADPALILDEEKGRTSGEKKENKRGVRNGSEADDDSGDDSDDDSSAADLAPVPAPIEEEEQDYETEPEVAVPPLDVPTDDFGIEDFIEDKDDAPAQAPYPGIFMGGYPYQNGMDKVAPPPEVPFPSLEIMEEFAVEPSDAPWFGGAAIEPSSFEWSVEVPAADDEEIENFLENAFDNVFG